MRAASRLLAGSRCVAAAPRLASPLCLAPRAAPQLALALVTPTRGKRTTGIVGLEVEPDAKPILLDLYAQTLSALEAVPPTAEYRKLVEGMTKERLAVIEKTDDLDVIEDTIGCGQVEQLIQQAKDELSLIPMLVDVDAFAAYDGPPAEDILTDLKRCAAPLQLASFYSTCLHWTRPPLHLNHSHASLRAPLRSRACSSKRRRGVALQRDDIPMRPSLDFPTETEIELELPAPPEAEAAK